MCAYILGPASCTSNLSRLFEQTCYQPTKLLTKKFITGHRLGAIGLLKKYGTIPTPKGFKRTTAYYQENEKVRTRQYDVDQVSSGDDNKPSYGNGITALNTEKGTYLPTTS